MIDTKELRPAVEAAGLNAISMQEVLELLGRLEAAEKERDDLRAEVESWKGLAQQFGNEADALRAKISRDTHSVTAGSCSWQSADLGR